MKRTIITLLTLLCSSNVLAWGATGHRIVGELAQRYLKKSTQKKVTEILDGHSLARASNWPDEIKSDPVRYGYTFSWHYTDWPDDQPHYEPHGNNGSLVQSIEDQLAVLRNKKATKGEKAFALKFLAHLVGDLHQPLHVGNGLDRGGNSCRVLFHKKESNMHRLWDEDMIDFTHLSFLEFAKFVDVVKKDDIKRIQQGSPLAWARESKELRMIIYPPEVGTVPNQAPGIKNYCQRDLQLPAELVPALGHEYSYKFMPLLERRLLEGGLRLAWLINQSLE